MKRKRPFCPRCGYDLSGEVATWNEACPLAGKCSECGLDFEWVDVMRPGWTRVAGFVEHARDRKELRRSVLGTLWLTARPGRFWNAVRVEFEPRLRRAALWMLGVLAVLWLAPAVLCWSALWLVGTAGPESYLWPLYAGIFEVDEWSESFELRGVHVIVVSGLAATLTIPGMLLLLSDTRRVGGLRWRHVARAMIYSWVWLIPLLLYRAVGVVAGSSAWVGIVPHEVRGVLGFIPDWMDAAGERWGFWLSAAALWLGWWWWKALSRGWRLREAPLVWWAIVIPALLTGLIAMVFSWEAGELFL